MHGVCPGIGSQGFCACLSMNYEQQGNHSDWLCLPRPSLLRPWIYIKTFWQGWRSPAMHVTCLLGLRTDLPWKISNAAACCSRYTRPRPHKPSWPLPSPLSNTPALCHIPPEASLSPASWLQVHDAHVPALRGLGLEGVLPATPLRGVPLRLGADPPGGGPQRGSTGAPCGRT